MKGTVDELDIHLCQMENDRRSVVYWEAVEVIGEVLKEGCEGKLTSPLTVSTKETSSHEMARQ